MEPSPHKKPIRFYEIDLLRFLAALSVVFYHYTYLGFAIGNQSPLPFPEIGRFTRYGYMGVELFFLISGYVVLLSAQGKTVRQFFISRVSRLYPAFWVACTITFLVERVWGMGSGGTGMPSSLHAGFGQYAYNMTMLGGFLGVSPVDGAYWSIFVEITFYFLVAVLLGWKLLQHLEWFICAWLIYCALPGLLHTGTPFAYLFFPQYAPYFAGGMLFYLLQQPNGRTWQRYALLAASYLLALREAITHTKENTQLLHEVFHWQVAAAAVTVFFILFYLIAFRKIDFSRFSWLSYLGSLTYPLYLLHSNIAYVVFHRLGNAGNKYALVGSTIVLMLLLAYLVHSVIEKRLGKWLSAHASKWLLYFNEK